MTSKSLSHTRATLLRLLGPGLVAGAADDDPTGIATYSQAGARFGYGLRGLCCSPTRSWCDPAGERPDRPGDGTGIWPNIPTLSPVVLCGIVSSARGQHHQFAADFDAMGASRGSLVAGGHAPALRGIVRDRFAAAPRSFFPTALRAGAEGAHYVLLAYVDGAFSVHVEWPRPFVGAVFPLPLDPTTSSPSSRSSARRSAPTCSSGRPPRRSRNARHPPTHALRTPGQRNRPTATHRLDTALAWGSPTPSPSS